MTFPVSFRFPRGAVLALVALVPLTAGAGERPPYMLTAAEGSTATLHAEAAAGLFKCRGPNNVPLYQDQPCPAGTELRDLTVDPPSFSVVPFEMRPQAPPPVVTKPPPPRPRVRSAEKKPSNAERAVQSRVEADPAQRRSLRDGMSEGEVIARLGVPDIQSGRGGKRTRWTYLPIAGDAQTITIVRFEDGLVVGVDRNLLR